MNSKSNTQITHETHVDISYKWKPIERENHEFLLCCKEKEALPHLNQFL